MTTPPPPPPPDQPRRFRLYLLQWIGMPVILLFPALALFGVFGRVMDTARASSGGLAVQVDYASRLRYKENNRVFITIANTSGRTLNNVTVACDSSYLATYEDPVFIPSAGNSQIIPIGSLAPGEWRHVRIEGKIETMWSCSGSVHAMADGGASVAAAIRTFVLP